MPSNLPEATRILCLFEKLIEIKAAVEPKKTLNHEEYQNDEFALVKLLDTYRVHSGHIPGFSKKAKAYLANRMHCLLPEKDLLDWQTEGLLVTGLAQVKRTAFVLMAAGAGSRLESLRDMDEEQWAELGLHDLTPSDFDHFSKATAPMGPVSKCATTELLLQSILAVARKSETLAPVIVCYDNKTECRLMEIMKRWHQVKELCIYLKKESFGLPAIANDGTLLFDTEGNLIVGSGGTGASLRALGEPGFTTLHQGIKHSSLFDYLSLTHPHIDTLCYLQTDMPCSPEVLLAVLGGKRRQKSQVSLAAYDYPADLQLGVVAKWKTPDAHEGSEIVDFADRMPEFDQLVKQGQKTEKLIPAYSGLMAFDLQLGEHIVTSGLFRPKIDWNKKERGLDGTIHIVNKAVLSLTDVLMEADNLSVIMMPSEELLPGKTPEVFAKCRNILSHKAKLLLRKKGFEIDDTVTVEISPLSGSILVGKHVRICDKSKLCFTGPLDQCAREVIFQNHITIKGNVTIIFEGKYPVCIPTGSELGGDGVIIFGRTPHYGSLQKEPLSIVVSKDQIIEVPTNFTLSS